MVFFLGIFAVARCKLVESDIYEKKIIGLVIMAGCFWCSESMVDAIRSVVYSLPFTSAVCFFALVIQTIILKQHGNLI